MALIDYSNQLPEGDGYQSLSVIGSTGAAYADDHQNMQLVFRGGHAQAVRAEETGRRHAALIQELVDGLKAGGDVSSTVADWRRVVDLANAVTQSMQTHSSCEPESVSPRTTSHDSNTVRVQSWQYILWGHYCKW